MSRDLWDFSRNWKKYGCFRIVLGFLVAGRFVDDALKIWEINVSSGKPFEMMLLSWVGEFFYVVSIIP